MEILYNILGFIAVVLLIATVVAVIRPSAFQRVLGKHATRLKLLGILFVLFLVVGQSLAMTEPASLKKERLAKEQAAAKSEQAAAKLESSAEEMEKAASQNKNSSTQPVTYTVAKVIDGDTIDVTINGKDTRVRLIGIDTPESKDPRKTVECFANEASDKLTQILAGKKVELVNDRSQGDKDKYKRLLRYIKVDGKNINELMISEGFANEYTYKTPYKYQKNFKAAQQRAKKSQAGLWPPSTCSGKRTKPAAAAAPAQPAPAAAKPAPAPAATTPAPSSGGVVKMSSSGICHAPGTTYYNRTTNFTSYPDLNSCIAAGGRLPLR